jgi:hypothetical protein
VAAVSGRPKPGRGDEAEQLRELTRQAHEAAQHLSAVLREYREAVAISAAPLVLQLQEYLGAQVKLGTEALNMSLGDRDREVAEAAQEAIDHLTVIEEEHLRRARDLARLFEDARIAAERIVALDSGLRRRSDS